MSTQERTPELGTVLHANVIDQTPDPSMVTVQTGELPAPTHDAITSERRRRLETAAALGVVSMGHNAAERLQAHATAAVQRDLIQG